MKKLLLSLTLAMSGWTAQAGPYNDAVAAFHRGDIAQAVESFFDLAVNNDDPDAQYVLASLFEGGEVVEQDMAQSLHWYREAAKNGNPFAQASLAAHLIKGEHVMRDYARALELFLAAARQGHPQSQFNAALMLEHGVGEQADVARARQLYEQAANQGHLRAQLNLGISLSQEASAEALTEAYKWLTLVANSDNSLASDARIHLGVVSRSMTASQLAAAKESINRFFEEGLMVAAPSVNLPTALPAEPIEQLGQFHEHSEPSEP